MPTAELLRLAEILDKAGFAYLEVSGGGVFDTAVRRGVESPWERIRALNERTETPLAMALRGRFLVGSRPVGGEFVSRFVASAAESGIEVFRLHDPLNDVENLREAGKAITDAGKEFDAGLVFGSGYGNETEALVEQARKLPELGASRVLLHDPASSLQPQRAQELVSTLKEASGLPVGLYCQGAGGNAMAAGLEASRAGADLIACAVYPVALTVHRISGEALATALAGLGLDTGVDVAALWQASELVDEHIGDEPVTPLAPRIAVRAAEHKVPPGLVAALDSHLRALIEGRYGSPPGPIDATVKRAVALSGGAPEEEAPVDLDSLRSEAEGLASSEEELLLLALFGEEAEPLLQAIRGRASGDESLSAGGVDQARAERIREIVRIVQESGVGEVTIEEAGMRVSVRRTPEQLEPSLAAVAAQPGEDGEPATPVPPADGLVRVDAPMVGVFYRAPQPGAPPFVQEGDTVGQGQTLCILEAMKLMNEIKADAAGIVRTIHVGNAEPVEFGQLLFELEPVGPPPLDAL